MGVIGWVIVVVIGWIVVGFVIGSSDDLAEFFSTKSKEDKEYDRKMAERKMREGDDFYKNNIEARRNKGHWYIWEKGYWKKK